MRKCDCGASAVNSPGHSEWCSSLKSPLDFSSEETPLDLHQLWVDDLNGLIPLADEDDPANYPPTGARKRDK